MSFFKIILMAFFALSLTLVSVPAGAAENRGEIKLEIYSTPPVHLNPHKRYLFYMHNVLIEAWGIKAHHGKYGKYDYLGNIKALAGMGFVVITEARLEEVDIIDYSKKIATEVLTLIERGVRPGRITVMGHEKGALMAFVVASMLEDPRINYIILSGCAKEGTPFRDFYEHFLDVGAEKMRGRMLSLYDTSELHSGACGETLEDYPDLNVREKTFGIRKGLGLFYRPREEWLNVVGKWIREEGKK
ncbi:MAG: hypothetical protein V3T30_09295 [Thermodesulfobacteriota bacterium]